ncbi:hypothetical protein [Phenylobacterium aquaticum]|uniref:hypothetical protein n=1 Tax=Phenylobacterium aquaticum TaxID=1763816 RepID=UPI0026EFFCCE|nr:hypothetical protein [Phenylobacterium aquaticum]
MVLRAYFDASYKVGDPAYVVAGYLGETEEWKRVEALWKETATTWGLPNGFHLTNLQYDTGGRGDECVTEFAEIIAQSELFGLSAGVEVAYLESEMSGAGRNAQWQVAADMLLKLTKEQVRLEHGDAKVIVVFDADAPDGVAAEVFEAFRDQEPFSHLSISRRSESPLLEIADLAAGLGRREWYGPEFTSGVGIGGDLWFRLANRWAGSTLSADTARRAAERRVKRGL